MVSIVMVIEWWESYSDEYIQKRLRSVIKKYASKVDVIKTKYTNIILASLSPLQIFFNGGQSQSFYIMERLSDKIREELHELEIPNVKIKIFETREKIGKLEKIP